MKNEIFKANPNLDCYFETTDSQCFFTDADAKNHAKTLEDKTIKPPIEVNVLTFLQQLQIWLGRIFIGFLLYWTIKLIIKIYKPI